MISVHPTRESLAIVSSTNFIQMTPHFCAPQQKKQKRNFFAHTKFSSVIYCATSMTLNDNDMKRK